MILNSRDSCHSTKILGPAIVLTVDPSSLIKNDQKCSLLNIQTYMHPHILLEEPCIRVGA